MRPDDVDQVDDALAYVRGRPSMFFRGGAYTADELSSLIVREALQAGAETVQVFREQGWTIIYSPLDWLAADAAASFRQIVPFPAGGQNAMRVEVLATAFAEAVATKLEGEVTPSKGDAPASLDHVADNGRAVAFR